MAVVILTVGILKVVIVKAVIITVVIVTVVIVTVVMVTGQGGIIKLMLKHKQIQVNIFRQSQT